MIKMSWYLIVLEYYFIGEATIFREWSKCEKICFIVMQNYLQAKI